MSSLKANGSVSIAAASVIAATWLVFSGCATTLSLRSILDSIDSRLECGQEEQLLADANRLAWEKALSLGQTQPDAVLAEATAASLGVLFRGRDEDLARLAAVAEGLEREGCGEEEVYPRVALLAAHSLLAVGDPSRAADVVARICGVDRCGNEDSSLAVECFSARAAVAHAAGEWEVEEEALAGGMRVARERSGEDSRDVVELLSNQVIAAAASGKSALALSRAAEFARALSGRWTRKQASTLAAAIDAAVARDDLCLGQELAAMAEGAITAAREESDFARREVLTASIRLLAAQGRFAEAMEAAARLGTLLGSVCERNPSWLEIGLAAGYLGWQVGDNRQMEVALAKARSAAKGTRTDFGQTRESRLLALAGRGYNLLGKAKEAEECFQDAARVPRVWPANLSFVTDLLLESAWLSWIRDGSIAWARPVLESYLEIAASHKGAAQEELRAEAGLLLAVDRFGADGSDAAVDVLLSAIRGAHKLFESQAARQEYVGYTVFLSVKILGARASGELERASWWFDRLLRIAGRSNGEYKRTHCLHRQPRERCYIQKAFAALARGKYIEDGRTDLADRWGAVHAAMECK